MYPRVRIHMDRLRRNLDACAGIIQKVPGCTLMIVTKGVCAYPPIVRMLTEHPGVDFLADSRIQNLKSYAAQARQAGKQTVLLRLSMPSEVSEVVEYADVSFQSELSTIRLLDEAAGRAGKRHNVVLMIDLGDLREGIFYEKEEEIFSTVAELLLLKHIRLYGLGTNLTCYGAIIPKNENLSLLVGLARKLEQRFHIRLPMVSGGNSSSIYLIEQGNLPEGINNLRLGESFLLGNDTAYGTRIPGTVGDALELEAEVIEIKEKPSLPVGEIGVDAFGHRPTYEDKGIMRRAIVAVGRQDVDTDSLQPRDPQIEILGGSSDHLLLDLTHCITLEMPVYPGTEPPRLTAACTMEKDGFRETLLEKIASAKQRICIVALYLEQDDGGKGILNALYEAKRQRPELDVRVLVDWHRAQRGRIGAAASNTNADWYCRMAQENPGVDVPVYGVPINTREALGVLHFKGFIIDDSVLYSGASLNDVYLHQHDKYRYDRYHLIRNRKMSDIMFEWVTQNIMNGRGVNRLDDVNRPKSPEIKNDIRLFRQELRDAAYHFQGDADNDQLSVTPLVGLGKSSLLNKTIFHLMPCAEQKLTICTPYFNLPAILVRNIIQLLREGKKVEIIVGDKTANDFYIPEDEPFKIIGALPYLYEINLRRFLSRLQYYVNTDQLVVRLWKDDDNTYHLKGMWVDDKWMLITGNNLNPRAWRLDLENAILIHDPQLELAPQREKELELIREHTTIVKHYRDLQSIADYPVKVRKLIRRLRRIRIDRLISRIL